MLDDDVAVRSSLAITDVGMGSSGMPACVRWVRSSMLRCPAKPAAAIRAFACVAAWTAAVSVDLIKRKLGTKDCCEGKVRKEDTRSPLGQGVSAVVILARH